MANGSDNFESEESLEQKFSSPYMSELFDVAGENELNTNLEAFESPFIGLLEDPSRDGATNLKILEISPKPQTELKENEDEEYIYEEGFVEELDEEELDEDNEFGQEIDLDDWIETGLVNQEVSGGNNYEDKLDEALRKLKPKSFSTPWGSKGIFDHSNWIVKRDPLPRYKKMLVLRRGKKPSQAIKDIVDKSYKWTMDCAYFVQVVHLYALSQTNPTQFDRKWRNREFRLRYHWSSGAGKKTIKYYFRKVDMTAPWKAYYGRKWNIISSKWNETRVLNKIPLGSRAMWSNELGKGSFINENVIKVGDEQYRAFGYGTSKKLTARQIALLLAAIARNEEAQEKGLPATDPLPPIIENVANASLELRKYTDTYVFLKEANSFHRPKVSNREIMEGPFGFQIERGEEFADFDVDNELHENELEKNEDEVDSFYDFEEEELEDEEALLEGNEFLENSADKTYLIEDGEGDIVDEEEELDEGEYAHDGMEFEEEDEGELALEAFRPSDVDEGALEEGFWDAQVGGGSTPRDFKLELELNYGMEKAIAGAPVGFPFIPMDSSRLPDGKVVTTHTKASDGFQVVMDGPRMEIETRRIGLEQFAELDRITTNILGFVHDLWRACKNKSPRTVSANASAGKVRDFHLPVFASPDLLAFPIKDSRKQRTWFRQNCRIGASPQCTIDLPLESVIEFVTELRRSQRRGRKRRWTGRRSSRAGLRSDALYHARDAVLKSFRAHAAAGRATNQQLTRKLASFMILLVQYLRTSEMLYHQPDRSGDATFTKPDRDSHDHEQFPKAYVPLVVHTHFHVMFHNILSNSERTLFMGLYGDSTVRQNLFDLALDVPGSKSGLAELFPSRTRGMQTRNFGSVLTWDQFVDSAIDLAKPIRKLPRPLATLGDISLPTPLAKASKGVAKTGAAGARVDGVRLEMRRLGYRWWRPHEWRSMSRHLYKIARKLNGIP